MRVTVVGFGRIIQTVAGSSAARDQQGVVQISESPSEVEVNRLIGVEVMVLLG